MGALGNSAELEAELIKRNREIAKVRDEVIKLERRLHEASLRNDDLLEKVSVLDSEVTKKTTLLTESEQKVAALEEKLNGSEQALETAQRRSAELAGEVEAQKESYQKEEAEVAALREEIRRMGVQHSEELEKTKADSAHASDLAASMDRLQAEYAEALHEVLQLHKVIFGDSRHPEDEWRVRLAGGAGFHLVIRQEGKILSFLTAYQSRRHERTTPCVEKSDCLHIWMAGTRSDCKKRGFMSAIFQKALDIADARGLRYVTLNTYPEKFPEMYHLATGSWKMTVDSEFVPSQGLSSGLSSGALFLGGLSLARRTRTTRRYDAAEPRELRSMQFSDVKEPERLCIVTGGTSRFGAAVARGLASSGRFQRILIVGRDHERGEAVVKELQEAGVKAAFEAVDLADQAQVCHFCDCLGHRAIHGLVLAAGVTALDSREETCDGYEMHFGLNYLSRFNMVSRLMENLKKGGTLDDPCKVLLCSSSRHRGEPQLGFAALGAALPLAQNDVQDLQLEGPGAYRPWKAFGQAALCNVMFAYELQKRLRAESDHTVAVSCFDPGPMTTAWHLYRHEENRWLSAGMSSFEKEVFAYFTRLVQAPEEAAEPVVSLATRSTLPGRGASQVGFSNYWEHGMPALSKFPLPWNGGTSYDEVMWADLWSVSQELLESPQMEWQSEGEGEWQKASEGS
ncbi:Dehydrogenase/reductase SDR family member on chromosome X (DHRSXY) (Short chain dehydrogenase/reductase family 46C member 1) (Short chain dehydrogenase/reductase family 7C member 6) [Durusdinium trenchii]|uniref:Dehydrogenase/reductase SDR family member on chromosome X (DHRSXY) (Short chain dehydrogenase/reductase family 46C member 1) (Short chain dehydrogenase/reductase family 7C member 6) n=1 Tax=Durusdinium trenchii TaxID=1381693 RepID=A0ABP0QQ30_9DINO